MIVCEEAEIQRIIPGLSDDSDRMLDLRLFLFWQTY